MAVTLTDLIAQISAIKQVWFSGVTTNGGTTTTLVCSSLIGRQFGAGQRVQVAGQDREIVSLDRNTGTLTFRPAHSSAVASGSAFTITAWTWEEITAAIVRAMYALGESWQVSRATQSTTALDGLHDVWDLPADCNEVVKVRVKAVGRGAWQDYPYFSVVKVDGARKLQLREMVAGPVMVEYLALITIPTEADDYISFGDNDDREAVGFVVNRGMSELLMSERLKAPTAEAARVLGELAQMYKVASENIRAAKKPNVMIGQIRRKPMPEHV